MDSRLKYRKISSVSGIITNSSTEIFEISIDKRILKILLENNIFEDILIIENKEDIINLLKTAEDIGAFNCYRFQMLLDLIGNNEKTLELVFPIEYSDLINNLPLSSEEIEIHKEESLFTEWNDFGELWDTLRSKNYSVREIVDMFEPCLSNLYDLIIYTYEDSYPNLIADLLKNHGYNSSYRK